MSDREWTSAEKKIARRAFEAALEAALAAVMAEFKTKAAAAATPDDMWSVERFLRERRQEIDETFDYRYSRLPAVFGRLILDGHLDEARLTGLSEDKLEEIRRYVSFIQRS
jgi:Photoprotection regulator fluorescence recovery protein